MVILIAEDDNVSRIILTKILKKFGHSVIESCDGIELKNNFLKFKDEINCIITDIMMPNMNGLEAIRDIKRIKKIPVVILSALDHNENIKDSQGNSLSWTLADLFLQKPLNMIDLKNILKTIEEIKNGR